ncbi:mechanosensitive ion channel family protein [Calothrix sp. PCC 6303]|uniref:mechanosensitive ion channel family protein n=1 Tax=Calothrix sp. PCC 6303 TaxID=1170562 RepID=UPI0002A03D9A|nr:mechanosensitive ion channel family protein [Calothrix sp. PCC 6303]AFZ03406.1 MscS Mechanosensitive ion channel [Calothrix sp. PCC 6303]
MTEQLQFILPIVFCLLGLLGGIVGDTIIYSRFKEIITRKKIPGSQIIFTALHRMTFLWFALAGLYGAIISYPGFQPEIALTLKKIVTAIFLYSVTLVLARLSAGFVSLYIRKSANLPASLFSNIAKTTVLVLGTLILLQTLGVEITPIITTLGISGLAVGLALKDTLENLFSGFYLLISKQIRTGDYIKLDAAHEGYITDINWRNTTIKELSNNIIIVPNSKLASAIFTNYHLPAKEVTLTVNVGVDYESDLEHVEQVTVEVAKEVVEEVAPELIETIPFIRFQNFGDFSIDFKVYIRVNEFFDQRLARHIFIKKLHRRFQKEGIKIPFPIRELYDMSNHNIKNGSVKSQ